MIFYKLSNPTLLYSLNLTRTASGDVPATVRSVLPGPAQPYPGPHEPGLHDVRGVHENFPLTARRHSRSGCDVADRQRHRQRCVLRCLKYIYIYIFIFFNFTVIFHTVILLNKQRAYSLLKKMI